MIAALLVLRALQTDPAVTVYVSPGGIDTAGGSAQAPVRSLGKALSLVHAPRKSISDPALIRIAAEDYPVSETIRLGARDANLIVQGMLGARLFAGRALTDWKPVTDLAVPKRLPRSSRTHVLVADVSTDPILGQEKPGDSISNLDLVYDHSPLQLARWPQSNFLLTGPVSEPQSFQTDSDDPFRWASGADVWAMGYWKYDYVQELNRVDLSKSGTVQLLGNLNAGLAQGRRFMYLNVLESLDRGEFYFDRTSHLIYLYPPPAARNDSTDHEVFIEETKAPLMAIKNSSDITIENLDIEGGRGEVGSVEGGHNVVFQRCSIRNFAGSGLSFHDSISSGVSRCELSGLGSFGISLDAGDRKTLAPAAEFADDNRIFNYARWQRSYRAAVSIKVVGNRASHNLIHDAPHAAIVLGGNDHVVEYNEIYKVCTEAGDAGAVYEGRDPSFRGLVVRFNHFADISPTVPKTDIASVYLDDRLSGNYIYGNIFEGRGLGVLLGGGRDNKIQNNVFADKTIGVRVDQRGKTWQAGKALETYVASAKEAISWSPLYLQRYPDLGSILTGDPGTASNNDVSENVSVGATDGFLKLGDGLVPAQFGNQNNIELVSGTLQTALDNAPAGIAPIPMKAIGPRPDH
jgi:hypothetical protein